GTIFDVFDLDFKSNEYNTELKKITFWETPEGQNYQKRLDDLENRLRNQGIKTIPLAKGSTTRSYITTISKYDVEERGFTIIIGRNDYDWMFDQSHPDLPRGLFQSSYYTNDIRGFIIPNITVPYFMSVPMDIAQRIEGNEKAVVQLQLEIDTFAIKKIFIINIDTLEIYAEEYYGKHDATSLTAWGIEYVQQGDFDNAITAFTQVIGLDPNHARAYSNRGIAYRNKGDYDRAIADYNQAIRLDPNHANAYYSRGIAYHYKGDYDRAIADYNQAIRLDPNHANAYYSRGLAYHYKGDRNSARSDWSKALELDPNNVAAQDNLNRF
ncbi:MAG: tetratricopeptide repeat protein, partial [Bacteroidales bacterium]|nr:tetratricopeptide repeat protein [Bacteroidales bacterium]